MKTRNFITLIFLLFFFLFFLLLWYWGSDPGLWPAKEELYHSATCLARTSPPLNGLSFSFYTHLNIHPFSYIFTDSINADSPQGIDLGTLLPVPFPWVTTHSLCKDNWKYMVSSRSNCLMMQNFKFPNTENATQQDTWVVKNTLLTTKQPRKEVVPLSSPDK